MDTLHKRLTFKISDDHLGLPEEDTQQEEIVQRLRQANTASNRQYLNFLRVILSLSFFLQLVSLLDSSHDNPLLAIIPSASQDSTSSIPLSAVFSLLSLLLHANIYFLAFPDDMTTRLRVHVADVDIRPLSYPICYALAAVAPTHSLFLRRAWQSSVWWGLTVAVIFIVETVTKAIMQGNESISTLETMKYVAHGA
ncbi:hypothetical protein L208DRAFT_1423448 [Tricholoma matsutake]|nr:hypothetical protein L208DRAFT_1423448 [Tricholoma matsutake 945]